MRIDELLWDEWNEEHVARHGVDQEEVEEAVFDPASIFLRTKSPSDQQRYIVLGLAEAGRYLFIVLEPVPGNRAYPITARDMSDAEKSRFKRRGG